MAIFFTYITYVGYGILVGCVYLREASGNIWAPTIIFSNSPLSDQTIVDQQVAENYIWIILDFKAALTVERKAAAIPAPPEEAVEVGDWNFFFQG